MREFTLPGCIVSDLLN